MYLPKLPTILVFLLLLPLLFLIGQKKIGNSILEPNHKNISYCASDEAWEDLLKSAPEVYAKQKELDANAFRHFQSNDFAGNRSAADYTLPVVVHIIHQNGAENISDAQVLQGIQDLNEAYANIGYYNPATGADTRIEFCLAKQDPDGNATTGITRTVSPLTEYNYSVDDVNMKNLSRWDPTQYINIWLAREICSNNGCGVAGYAYFPSAHGNLRDGIAQEARWFGSSQGASGVQIHELGHYLGIYHTFQGGCVNNNCLSDGDQVCDTPPDQSTVPVPCGGTANSCNTDVNAGDPNNPFVSDQEDMYWNYMDYGDFNCYSAFTPGQVDRMHFFLTGVRSSLLDSKACQNPCITGVNAFFTASATMINVGQTINFTNASTNATTYNWEIDGVSQGSTTNLSYTFSMAGTYTITLIATNADPNCEDTFELEIEVVCPVDSDFTLNPQLAQPGDVISFVNNSSNATSYTWTVNAAFLSSLMTPAYTAMDPGLYTICLLAGNDFCEEEHCETLLVGPGEIECEETFLKTYGIANVDEEMRAIVNTPDGNLIVGGQVGSSALLVGMGLGGDILWQKTLEITNRPDQIYDMILDSDGFIVGVGVAGTVATGRSCFAFKYDWQNDLMIWSRSFSNPDLSLLARVLEITSGNYVIVGQLVNSNNGEGCNGLWMEVDKNNGSRLKWAEYHLGSCETFSAVAFSNNRFYATGRYNFAGGGTSRMRIGMTAMDLNGSQDWSRLYIENINKDARMYSSDILEENNHLIVIGIGDRNGTSVSDVETLIFSTDLNGEVEWAQSLQIPGVNTERMYKLFSVPDGFLIAGAFLNDGTSNRDVFLMKTDKLGNELWTKAFDIGQEDTGFDITFQGGFIFLAGNVGEAGSSTQKDAFLAKLTLDGTTTEPCQYIRDLDVQTNTIASPYDGLHPLSSSNNNFNLATTNTAVQDVDLQTEVYCTAPCQEICNNDIDDDGDGLVDEYDSDCECLVYDCDNNAILDCPDCQAVPPLSSKWEIETVWSYDFPDANSTRTPVVGDVDGDCVPDVVSVSQEINAILIIDGQTGLLKYQIPTYATGAGASGNLVIGDVDRNGAVDIFTVTGDELSNPVSKRHRLVRYEFNGSGFSEIFTSAEAIGPYDNFDITSGERYDILSLNLADVNGDGRPEVVVGNEVFDAVNGDFLVDGGPQNSVASPYAWVGNTNRGRIGSYGVVADVLPDAYCPDCAGLELIAGNMVYAIGLTPGGGPNSGTMSVAVDMSSQFFDGMVSVADLNLDGLLDVVTTQGDPQIAERYYVTAWNPALGIVYDELIFNNSPAIGSGRTGIANLDDQEDDLEIVFHINPFVYSYKFNPTSNQFSLLAQVGVDDASRTSVSIFDFNGDGENEILYRDQNEMRILKGSDLTDLVLPTYSCGSGTNLEYPFVVDVNADGQAEIIIMCDGDLRAIGNAENGKFWASARKVWNQFSYFNVNVNDDLTIPIQQQAHHLTGDSINFNTFLKQYSNPNFPVANATLEIDSIICQAGDSLQVILEVCNIGDNILSALTPITIYEGNPTIGAATALVTFPLGSNIIQDSCQSLTYTFSYSGSATFFIVINDNASLSPPFNLANDFPVTTIPECDYTNNLDSIEVIVSNLVLDLGPDIEVCDNGIWYLDAGPGFKKYLWQDGSSSENYTAWEPGIYWVEVESFCGNLQRDTVIISILENTIVKLPEDIILCPGDSIDLSLNGFATYQWWPDVVLDCQNCPSVKVKPLDSTLVVVVVSTPDGCYSTDSILITIQEAFEIEEELYLCDGDTIELHGDQVWLPGTYSFDGSSTRGCDSMHTTDLFLADNYLIDLDSLILCEGDTTLVFGTEVWEEGGYTRTFTTVQGCDSILQIAVTLEEVAMSSDSLNICAGDTVVLFGENAWIEGVYSEMYATSANCDSTAFTFLFVEPLETANENATLCTGDTIVYFGLPITVGGLYENRQSVPGECDSLYRLLVTELFPVETGETQFLCPGDTIEVFGEMVAQAGTYKATFTATFTGCDSIHTIEVEAMDNIETVELFQLCVGESIFINGDTIDQPGEYSNWIPAITGCDTLQTIILEWWPEPELNWSTFPACSNEGTGRIEVAPSGANPPFEIEWEVEVPMGNNLENVIPGIYPVTLTDAQGCSISTEIELEEVPSPTLILQDSLVLNLGETGQIEATVFSQTDSLSYSWSPITNLTCTDCLEPEVLAINSITYVLTVRNAEGCEVSGQVHLRVQKDRNVYIPNAFSPNGDGMNDWLTVYSDESVAEVVSFRIFDRWGEEVIHLEHFQTNHPTVGWDGRFLGKYLNPGIYVYVAKVLFKDQTTDTFAGDVALIR